jgi:hypothetical protein
VALAYQNTTEVIHQRPLSPSEMMLLVVELSPGFMGITLLAYSGGGQNQLQHNCWHSQPGNKGSPVGIKEYIFCIGMICTAGTRSGQWAPSGGCFN